MKRKLKELVTKSKLIWMTMFMYVLVPMQVYASGTGSEPIIVSGTRALLAAGIGILTAFAVAVMTFFAVKTGIQMTSASPEERPKYQKELIGTIIAGLVTLTIGGTISWIVGFYQ